MIHIFKQRKVTNTNFLLTISIYYQEIRLWELIKWSPKRKSFDLYQILSTYPFKEMYRDQFDEFVSVKKHLLLHNTKQIPFF